MECKLNTDLICPITLKKIKIAGITSLGSIYEYDAIKKWLEDNYVDPLSNLVLPTKFVVKMENESNEKIIEKSKDIKLSTKYWFSFYRISLESPAIYEKLLKLKENTNSLEWKSYDKEKSKQLGDSEYETLYFKKCQGVPEENFDDGEPLKRPSNTGCRFQFITITNKLIQSANFKSELFDFAYFKDCVFYNCDFSRARFIGTTFDGVYFRKCSFIGEEISFYKATIGRHLTFDKCSMEYVEKWKTTGDVNEIKKILKDRLLEGKYSVN